MSQAWHELCAYIVARTQTDSVCGIPDIESFPLPQLLSPFLRVILSPRTTGPITSIALQAVHRLLIYNIVRLPRSSSSSSDSLGAQLAVAEIAHAVSHCRFEASDSAGDEVVLLRILAVMREVICADGGGGSSQSGGPALVDYLSDEGVCEMMETGLSMCCQMRLSDLLRRTAEQSMTTMVRALFVRLRRLPTTADESFSADPSVPGPPPDHDTLAAEPIGTEAAGDEKKLRRMTMPDPTSRDVPAAAGTVLQQLKEMGEAETALEVVQEEESKEAGEQDHEAPGDGTEEASTQEKKVEPEEPNAAAAGESQDAKEAVQEREEEDEQQQPFGLPAIKEVLRVIVSLLDPHNAQHTDTMRLLGLSMLCSVFEVAGESIGRFPSLRAIVQDSACKHLLQLARSDNSTILTYSLRTINALFATMREHLKLQYELFLTFLLDRLAPTFPIALEPWNEEKKDDTLNPTAPGPPPPPPPPPMPKSSERAPAHGEMREMILETLALLLGNPETMVELWANYDCDVDCENMFERVIGFLCRSVYASHPSSQAGIQDGTQLLAVDILLDFVSSMAARQSNEQDETEQEVWPEGLPAAESLTTQKNRKAAVLDGAARFNAKPKDGLAYLEREGFIDVSQSRPQGIATFLKECPRLDKKLLGDYISRPDNLAILEAFLGNFDFRGKPIAEAMREMLESFRLPGESQQIARITETFAKTYFAAGPEGIKNEDAVYVLSYSVIMLNTDQHSPQNHKRRMTLEEYRKNLRGVNDGVDFDPEFLTAIYESIRRREIVMPEEHLGQLGFDYAWKELLRKSRKAGALLAPPTRRFDGPMFAASWRPIVASVAHAFSTFRDEHMLERAISGFRQCAILASRFGMYDLFDFMIRGLAGATGLLDANVAGGGVLTNNATVEVEGSPVTVSPLSVRFGMNFKGQLAAVVLFTIANGNGDAIRRGWSPIFEIFKNLFLASLLPSSLVAMHEFGSASSSSASSEPPKQIPLKPRKAPGPPPQDPRAQGGGLFSTLSSYLLSPYSNAQEPAMPDVTDEDVESSLCTADCVASCRIEDLYSQILELHAVIPCLTALRDLAEKYTVERRNQQLLQSQEGSSSGRSTPVQGQTHAPSAPLAVAMARALPYDPSAAFILELLITVACGVGQADLQEAWTIATSHIQSLLQAPTSFHPLQIERAVVSLLRLTQRASIAADEAMRHQIFVALDQLRSLPVELRPTLSTQVTLGLGAMLRADENLVRSQTEWNIVLAILSDFSSARNALAARTGFDLLRFIAQERLSADNYAAVVAMLCDIAAAAETKWTSLEREGQRRTLTEKKELAEFEEACQQRGTDAIEVLDSLRPQVPRLIESNGADGAAWKLYWSPLLIALCKQYTNGHRPARLAAISVAQRALLDPQATATSPSPPLHVFYEVVFPMLDELLKPQVYQKDPSPGAGGMQETRIRACALLAKIFLHHLGALSTGSSDEQFQDLWLAVLDFFDRFMHAGKRDQLTEATPENLKNVLLVMNASGLLLPPPPASTGEGNGDTRTKEQAVLFSRTFDRIQRFLPKLKEELFSTASSSSHTQTQRNEVPQVQEGSIDESSKKLGGE